MLDSTNTAALIGTDVLDRDGDKIGTVGQVYVNPDNGTPLWASVKTGLFGRAESFVPLETASSADGRLRVDYEKAFVKDAPRVDPDGALNEQETDELYDYYHHTGGKREGQVDQRNDTDHRDMTDRDTTGRDTTDRDTTGRDTTDRDTTGHDVSGPTTDDAMTRSEERLDVGTNRVESGRARLHKYVVTKDQHVDVPVSHEEVRLDREPITDANVDSATVGPDISDEDHEVVLTEEQVNVNKKTVPVERVALGKETFSGEQRVDEPVRKEEVELQDGAGRGTRR